MNIRTHKLIVFLMLGLFLAHSLSATLPGVYRNKKIKLVADPEFGKNIDWDDPVYFKPTSIVVAEDGCVFAAYSDQHKIIKFSKEGRFLKAFGRKGEGPADLYHPRNLSILDNKYLMVNEYATKRRISLFHLDGRFFKIVKTRDPVSDSVGLKNNKIAILTYNYPSKERKTQVFIRDISSGKEISVASSTEPIRKVKVKNSTMMAGELDQEVFIFRTKDGNLLTGFSYENELNVYSPGGKKLKTIRLNIEPVKVTSVIVERYKNHLVKAVKQSAHKSIRRRAKAVNDISTGTLEKVFSEQLPFYSDLLMDGRGNVLVFKYYFSTETGLPGFDVYNADGVKVGDCEFLCEGFELKPGTGILKKIVYFHDNALYGLITQDNGEDMLTKILKIKLIGATNEKRNESY